MASKGHVVPSASFARLATVMEHGGKRAIAS